jgi:hypothetical protein
MRLVGLGAICDLDPSPSAINDERQHSFTISEFARLDNGERVVLHAERGYSGRIFPSGSIWAHLTVETITRDVLNVVLPDPEDGEGHPWEWLAELAQAQGIAVTADELRQVPYEVVLTERVIRRLSIGPS